MAAELKVLHQAIRKIENDTERFSFNTAVSSFMIATNELTDLECHKRKILEPLLILLTPYAPHIAEEMWEGLGHAGGLLSEAPRWPVADPELARREELEIPIQVNGKLRSRVIAAPGVSEDELRASALSDERVQALINGRQVVKVIVVPERLINIVVS